MNLRLVFLPRAEGDQPWSTLVDPEGRIIEGDESTLQAILDEAEPVAGSEGR
jgi:hypothetical protein